jgi:hypothetical protein
VNPDLVAHGGKAGFRFGHERPAGHLFGGDLPERVEETHLEDRVLFQLPEPAIGAAPAHDNAYRGPVPQWAGIAPIDTTNPLLDAIDLAEELEHPPIPFAQRFLAPPTAPAKHGLGALPVGGPSGFPHETRTGVRAVEPHQNVQIAPCELLRPVTMQGRVQRIDELLAGGLPVVGRTRDGRSKQPCDSEQQGRHGAARHLTAGCAMRHFLHANGHPASRNL